MVVLTTKLSLIIKLKNIKDLKQKQILKTRLPSNGHEFFLSLIRVPLTLPLPEKVKQEKGEYKSIPSKRPTTDPVRDKNY